MPYSRWLKTDLHIHSHFSKRTKHNDYDGEDLTYDKLVNALKKEKVNLFSITDHNTINVPLYEELIQKKDILIENNLNFIIGSEIDFLDPEIHDRIFHMLVYFNSVDLTQISKVFTDIYGKDSIDDIGYDVQPITLSQFFRSVFDSNKIEDVITIPHFNNKDKGIPPKDQIDKFVYTVFNALEDSNNRNNLIKSIQIFKNSDYNDIPIVVFSDNHNIDQYPRGKNGSLSKLTSLFVLGNIKFPYSSVKLAFQDVNTRVSIENLGMRCTINQNKYIKSINVDGEILNLSEYQNTIIGGFGTGKSFLLDMIINGKNNISDKYKDLANKYETFNLLFSDDTTRASLFEIGDDIKIIKFDQYKDIYFKNILFEDDKATLEKNLQIKFPKLNSIEKTQEDELINLVNKIIQNYDDTIFITDTISYEAYNRKNEKSFTYQLKTLEAFYETPVYFETLQNNLQEELSRRVLDKDIYLEEEKQCLSYSKDIINKKNLSYENISNKINIFIEKLSNEMNAVNTKASQQNVKISSSILIVNDIKEDIKQYIILLKELKYKSNSFEEKFSKDKYIILKDTVLEQELFNYKLVARYNAKEEYPDYFSDIFKPNNRKEHFFQSIIFTLDKKEPFTQNQKFDERIIHYLDSYYSNFKNIIYDIYDQDISIMKKSAGEKANVIINIIFKIIEDYSSKKISCIILLDQPEDNLDNKGIQNEVVDRIRNMKSSNCMPQLICVTHNANISITADSENIILAKKENDKCKYTNSGIENTVFINEVCTIIEGGQTALKRRGSKFNIPFIKELERGI